MLAHSPPGASRPPAPPVLIGVLFVVLSVTAFEVATYHGIGILPDSTRYMRLVEEPYDAPLYPWLLDMFRLADQPVVNGAEILGLVLIAINTLLIWLMLVATTSLPAAIIGTALIVFSPLFIAFHTVAMSEPLFIGLVLATVLLFCAYFRSRSNPLLILTGATLGLAMLTRFNAAAVALAISACLLIDQRMTLSRRIANIGVVAAVSSIVFFSWVVGSELSRGQAVGRELELNGNPDARLWFSGLEALTITLFPSDAPLAFRVAVLVAVIAICAAAIWIYSRRLLQDSSQGGVLTLERQPLILGLFVVFYFFFMVAAVHIEANLPLNGRYALPLYIAAVMAAAIAVGGRYTRPLPLFFVWAVAAISVIVLSSHVIRSANRVWNGYQSGIGYDAAKWHASPLAKFVSKLPPDAVVYSNGADALSFLTERTVRFVPFRFDRRTGQENPEKPLEAQIAALRRSIASHDTYVIFDDAIDWRFYAVSESDLVKAVPLKPYATFSGGRIYVGAHSRRG